jgi:hypothetical protein
MPDEFPRAAPREEPAGKVGTSLIISGLNKPGGRTRKMEELLKRSHGGFWGAPFPHSRWARVPIFAGGLGRPARVPEAEQVELFAIVASTKKDIVLRKQGGL